MSANAVRQTLHLAMWKIKYPISPLLFDKAQAKAFLTLPVVFAQCSAHSLRPSSFHRSTHKHIQWSVRGSLVPSSHKTCLCSIFLMERCNSPNVCHRFDKSSNKLQLACSAKGNILIFAPIACKSHFISPSLTLQIKR